MRVENERSARKPARRRYGLAAAAALAASILPTNATRAQEVWTHPSQSYALTIPPTQWSIDNEGAAPSILNFRSLGISPPLSCSVSELPLPVPSAHLSQSDLNANVRAVTREVAVQALPDKIFDAYELLDVGAVSVLSQRWRNRAQPGFQSIVLLFATRDASGVRMHQIYCATLANAPEPTLARVDALFKSLQFPMNGSPP